MKVVYFRFLNILGQTKKAMDVNAPNHLVWATRFELHVLIQANAFWANWIHKRYGSFANDSIQYIGQCQPGTCYVRFWIVHVWVMCFDATIGCR